MKTKGEGDRTERIPGFLTVTLFRPVNTGVRRVTNGPSCRMFGSPKTETSYAGPSHLAKSRRVRWFRSRWHKHRLQKRGPYKPPPPLQNCAIGPLEPVGLSLDHPSPVGWAVPDPSTWISVVQVSDWPFSAEPRSVQAGV